MIIIKKKVILFLIITIGFLFSLTFIVLKTTASNYKKILTIYIDPGHGGFDGGCESLDKKYVEKNITLEASLILTHYLRSSGYRVLLTRTSDTALAHHKKDDIYKRVDMINKSNASIYISIHVNSYPSKLVKGTQVFYKKDNPNSKVLSSILMDKIQYIDGSNNRTALPIKGKYLVDNVLVPGCLIELGFITNEDDLNKLTTDACLKDICLTLYLGIVEYLEYVK